MHIPYCFCCGTMFTNKEWEFNLLQGLHSIAQPSFVRVSLSISKLHEHAYSHCSLRKGYCLPTSYQCIGVIALSLIYLFTKFHTSKHLGKGVTQTCMFTLFFVVVRTNTLAEYWCHIINSYLFTKFHTSKRLGKRVTQTRYQNVGVIIIINPYLFTKFHASKHFGKRVTKTCMPYCNVRSKKDTSSNIPSCTHEIDSHNQKIPANASHA